MLNKKFRLSRKQINFLHKRGRKLNAGSLSIKYIPNHQDFPRFAVNVPTSVYKKATDRNRLRRIIYDRLAKMNVKSGTDCLISVYKDIPEENLEGKLRGIFDKIYV